MATFEVGARVSVDADTLKKNLHSYTKRRDFSGPKLVYYKRYIFK